MTPKSVLILKSNIIAGESPPNLTDLVAFAIVLDPVCGAADLCAERLLADEPLRDVLLFDADLAVQLQLAPGGRVARRHLAPGPRSGIMRIVNGKTAFRVTLKSDATIVGSLSFITGRSISWRTWVGLTLIWDVPASCPAAQSVLPNPICPGRTRQRASQPNRGLPGDIQGDTAP